MSNKDENPSLVQVNDLNNLVPKTSPNSNFANAFKTSKPEQFVKNASSWSSLANSPQNATSGPGTTKALAVDTFQAFRKQAIEKKEREKAKLEQMELRKQQKEQAEKERLRLENEKRREREEEEALEKARFAFFYFFIFLFSKQKHSRISLDFFFGFLFSIDTSN